jgi:cytoskeletal protein RodZ
MDTLGEWLRQAREGLGSTLEEAAAATRIRARFLEALEAGDFAAFPGGDVQLRGFLRIYARFLVLPPDVVLARYDAEVRGAEPAPASVSEEKQPSPPVQAPTRPMSFQAPTRPMSFQPPSLPVSTARPRRISLETVMVGGLVFLVLLAIVAVVGFVITRTRGGEAAATATAPAAAALSATSSETIALQTTALQTTALPTTASQTPTLPTVTPTFPASPLGGVTLALEGTEHTWVRVAVDGQTVLEGMLTPGQVDTWSGQEAILVDTGNGAGVQVTVNGQPQGAMCGRAQVCTRGWGSTGEVIVP